MFFLTIAQHIELNIFENPLGDRTSGRSISPTMPFLLSGKNSGFSTFPESTFIQLRNASLIVTRQSSSIRFRGKQLLFTNLNFLPVIIGLETSAWVFFTIKLVNFFEISTETSWFTIRLPAYCLISGNSVKFTQIFLKS